MYLYVLCEKHAFSVIGEDNKNSKGLMKTIKFYLGLNIITAVLLRVLTRHFFGKTMALIDTAGVWLLYVQCIIFILQTQSPSNRIP